MKTEIGSEVMQQVTMEFRIKRELTIRLWIAKKLVYLAAWIAKFKINEVDA